MIKKRNPDAALPDFYNISLERPKDDDLGYGVMFVEVCMKPANYALSRYFFKSISPITCVFFSSYAAVVANKHIHNKIGSYDLIVDGVNCLLGPTRLSHKGP